jgi:hypothetical protein
MHKEQAVHKKHHLRFVHIFIAAAFLIVLINFAISGFAPFFMVLIPAFPFLLLCVFPIIKKNDPSAAELYEIDFWLFVFMAAASLLIPLILYIVTRRKNNPVIQKELVI